MSKVIELRRRLQSFYKINKMTKAMQVVAVAELKKLQLRQKAASHLKRHYDRLMGRLKIRSEREASIVLPVIRIFLFGSERGFCGGFNEKLLPLIKSLEQTNNRLEFITIGNKMSELCKEARLQNIIGQMKAIKYKDIGKLAGEVYALWQTGQINNVYIIYNEFKSMLIQTPGSLKVLPFDFGAAAPSEGMMIVEPDYAAVREAILLNYIKALFYEVFLQSRLGEVASRLMTMRNATENSKEMIASLNIQFNKARQAMITVELSEILSSFEILSEGEG